MPRREVRIAELEATADARDVLAAAAVGSCLVIVLYDCRRRIGALGHALLPSAEKEEAAGPVGVAIKPQTYVDGAIDLMLERLEALGAGRGALYAKLIGGANMFPELEDDVGRDNIARARERLGRAGIPVVAEAVGGSSGRSVEFSVSTGEVKVSFKI